MRTQYLGALVLITLVGGCDASDQRAVELATESADRQAEQNQVMADVGREMSENQRKIVEAVAESRSELLALQTELSDQRRQLDDERKAIANERRYESLLAAVAEPAGWFALSALPLVLCWLILSDLRRTGPEEAVISQLLVDQLAPVTSLPGLPNGQPALDPASRLESPDPPIEPPF